MTEKTKVTKSRNYCFTINNYTGLEYTAVLEIECRYLVVGKEVGLSGTPHLQGFISFENPRSFKGVSKLLPRAYLTVANGTPLQASAYCKKDGDFVEVGECPNQGQRNDLTDVKESIQQGLGMREIVNIATNFQSLRTAEVLLKYIERKRDWQPEVIWVYGPSGIGKTRWAYDNYPFEDIHKQMADQLKWFQGYDAHAVVIIDEVNDSTEYSRLKELCDRYPAVVECKGGSRQFLAKTVVLTSLYDPNVLFRSHPENGKEMLRRISKIISL